MALCTVNYVLKFMGHYRYGYMYMYADTDGMSVTVCMGASSAAHYDQNTYVLTHIYIAVTLLYIICPCPLLEKINGLGTCVFGTTGTVPA